jgi:competence protein ComEA
VSDLDRPRLGLYLALGLIVCALGARELRGEAPARPQTGSAPSAHGATPRDPPGGGGGAGVPPGAVRVGRVDGGRATVHVAGAVRRPGVYRLAPGARVDDALRRAGGPTARADTSAVNLAARLEDGRQILVPERAPAAAGGGARAPGAGSPAPPAAGAGSPAAGGASAAAAPPINLNTATLEQLDTLDGVGPGIAQRILAYREERGGFRRVDELGAVPGIGPKRLAALTPRVTV